METHKFMHAIEQAQECALGTIDHIHHEGKPYFCLTDDEIDRVRDSMQILMYSTELKKALQNEKA